MIELTNLVTLDDDNEYVVVAKTNYNNNTYYFFVDINNNKNIKFLCEDNDELVEIDDDNTIRNLIPLFMESMKEILPEGAINEARSMITDEDIKEILTQYQQNEE